MKVGDMLYISGCLPLNLDGEVVGPGDIQKQTVQTLANVKAIAEAGGSKVKNIIKTIVSIPGNLANLVNL
jgi:enamine deaminase RidA (YjgF/YER057c/UK114 family)